MRNFWEKYENLLLIGIAFIIVALIVAIFIWSIAVISFDINKAIGKPSLSQQGANFNLEGAQKLDLRGLVQ